MAKTCDTCGGEITEWMMEHEPTDCVESLLREVKWLKAIIKHQYATINSMRDALVKQRDETP